jgi:phosphoribosyl 1,2-cyclic phosphodiesterase
MSLFISSLNSGSNGNCYYVANEEEAILIDAGISCREIEKRLKRLNLLIQKIKAVFISHEHSDHIKGLGVLAKKYRLPVYITSKTKTNCGVKIENDLCKSFDENESVLVGKLAVTAFPKSHDAIDPYSFLISFNGICVGVFTDIGSPCARLIDSFRQCHAAFLEANYDDEMLQKGRYPVYLKKRIGGDKGHLSNQQALDLFLNYRPSFMSHLLLSHLSKNNNRPELVEQLFNQHCGNVKIIVASRDEETKVFQIDDKKEIASQKYQTARPTAIQAEFSFS